MVVLDGNCAVGCGSGTDCPYIRTYISMYARTNRCYNERGARTSTSYFRSSIPRCTSIVRHISPRELAFLSSPIHYVVIILLFNAIFSVLPKKSLNEA
jgi:hypothetical protein